MAPRNVNSHLHELIWMTPALYPHSPTYPTTGLQIHQISQAGLSFQFYAGSAFYRSLCRDLLHLDAYVIPSPSSLLLIPKPPIQRPTYIVLRTGIRLITVPATQARPVPPVTPIRNHKPQQRPRAHVVHIMAIVLTPADGNHGGTQQRRQAKHGAREIAPRVDGPAAIAIHFLLLSSAAPAANNEQPDLPGEEEAQVPEPREAEARVAAGEAPPAVLEDAGGDRAGGGGGGADVDADEGVRRGTLGGPAAGEEVGAGAAHGVLDGVGYEGG